MCIRDRVRRQRAALTLQRRERELRDEAAATLARRRAQLESKVERDVENLRRDLADREAALSRRRADIKREMDALVLKYEACATEACGAREAFQSAAADVRARADEEAAQQARQVDDAIRARLEREAKERAAARQPKALLETKLLSAEARRQDNLQSASGLSSSSS